MEELNDLNNAATFSSIDSSDGMTDDDDEDFDDALA